jgi:hypothetical protein
VCNCNGVTKKTIAATVGSGVTSVTGVMDATRGAGWGLVGVQEVGVPRPTRGKRAISSSWARSIWLRM